MLPEVKILVLIPECTAFDNFNEIVEKIAYIDFEYFLSSQTQTQTQGQPTSVGAGAGVKVRLRLHLSLNRRNSE